MNDITQKLSQSLSITAAPDRVLYRELSYQVVGAAMEVHRRIGPGMLESVYQRSMESELRFRGIPFRAQAPIALQYRDDVVGEFFADLIVEDKIILELKSVAQLLRVHRAQLLSYLHASGLSLGILINFNVALLKEGVRRVVL